MVNTNAQDYLNNKYNILTTTGSIKKIDNSKKAAPTEKLIGKLVIENYPDLEEINLNTNELTELIIRNCPKLTEIDVNDNKKLKLLKADEIKLMDGSPIANGLESLLCTSNEELEI